MERTLEQNYHWIQQAKKLHMVAEPQLATTCNNNERTWLEFRFQLAGRRISTCGANKTWVLLDGASILTQSDHATGDITVNDLKDDNFDANVDKILFLLLGSCKSEALACAAWLAAWVQRFGDGSVAVTERKPEAASTHPK